MSITDKIAERVDDLPMMSEAVSRLLEVTHDKDHHIKQVVRVIETDASLTSRVLKIANSAAFSRGRPIETLPTAIMHLGEQIVTGIALSMSSSHIYNHPLDGYGSTAGELWNHSLRSAIAARRVAQVTKSDVMPGLAFTAGLLHDIGKAVISEFLEGNTVDMASMFDEGKVKDYILAEKQLLDTDHTEVGLAIARRWGFPDPLCEAIEHHHYPGNARNKYRPLVYMVHLGDLLAMLGGCGTGADALAYKVDKSYWHYFQINKKQLLMLFMEVQEEYDKIKSYLVVD